MRPSSAYSYYLLICFLLLAPLAHAADYGRDVGGDFDDPVWTRGVPTDDDYAKNVGPPGANDTGTMQGGAVTATGGSVKALASFVDFIVNGSFFAGSYVSTATLQGSGKLTTNDIGPGVTVQGGNLIIPGACKGSVTLDGGSFHAGSYSAHNLAVAGSGEATIDDDATDLNAQVSGGSTLTVPSVKNGRDIGLKVTGASSSFTTTGGVSIAAGTLEVSGGSSLKVGGAVSLDGGKDVDGDDIGGGGNAGGKDTFISAKVFKVGNTAPRPGFAMKLDDGAVLSSNSGFIGTGAGSYGTMTMSGAGTIWHCNGAGLSLGDGGEGELDMDSGAQLQFEGGAFAVGFSNGSRGTLTADGTGTIIDARPAVVSIGKDAGSHGNLTLDNGASLSLAQETFVGDGGNGGLNVSGGSQVSVGGSANFGVGNTASGEGGVSIQGTGSRFAMDDGTALIVGVFGSGFFGAGNGGAVQTSHVAVGTASTASGQIVLDGSGTTWTTTRQMGVGGNPVKSEQGPGSVTVQNGAQLRVGASQPDVLFISPTGQIILDGTGQVAVGAGAFGPGGTLRVSAPGVLRGKGKRVGSTIYNTNVTGKVIIAAGGQFRPGGDPDVFSIQGDCDLNDSGAGGGETDFEIGGAGTAGTDYDQLAVSGTVTLGGTLNLVLLPGYVPKIGDKLNVIRAKTVAGGFARINAPGLTVNPVPVSGGLSVTVTGVTAMSAPTITSATTAAGSVGADFSYQIAATNTPAGYTADGLPDSLELDPVSGLITGTPTAAGTYAVTLTATNTGGTGTATLTLTIGGTTTPGAPIITSAASAAGQVGAAFSYGITASNGPMSFAASGLPAGLSLDAVRGTISGTPTAAGTFAVGLSATNAKGTGTATLTLTIAPVVEIPTVTIVLLGDGAAVEGSAPGKAAVVRTGDTSAPLTVRYKVKGTAQAGKDYKPLSGVVVIPAGAVKAKIKIKPIDNATHDGTRLAKIKLKPAADGSYNLGISVVAKVKIIDND